MKNSYSTLITGAAIVAGLAAFTFSGCSKHERSAAADDAKEVSKDVSAKAKEVYQDSKAAVADAWADVKSYTFEKRDDFKASAKAMTAKAEAQWSEARADYSEANASASRKAAMAEFKDSQANYKSKVDALGNATADTWDSAKQNVIAAWDRVQAAYYKARAN